MVCIFAILVEGVGARGRALITAWALIRENTLVISFYQLSQEIRGTQRENFKQKN